MLDIYSIMQYTLCVQNKKIIKDIADVITGYTFRSAVKEKTGGSLYVLQAKNIKDDLMIDESLMVNTECDTSHTRAFARDGDVAISTRGFFRSAVLHSNKKILASSSVYLLRIKESHSIMPEYLALYFNSAIGQQQLGNLMTGAAIKFIALKDLKNMKIPLVAIKDQQKLVILYCNIKKQEQLLKKKRDIQKNIINGALKQMLEE